MASRGIHFCLRFNSFVFSRSSPSVPSCSLLTALTIVIRLGLESLQPKVSNLAVAPTLHSLFQNLRRIFVCPWWRCFGKQDAAGDDVDVEEGSGVIGVDSVRGRPPKVSHEALESGLGRWWNVRERRNTRSMRYFPRRQGC